MEVEVHTADHPFRSWKDFFLHLLTITVGLFMALSLQAAVESLHHRHLVRDARENLRREIAENHQLFDENAAVLVKNREQLSRDIDVLRDLRSGKKPDHIKLGWSWDWSAFNDASWRTARDIGAISFMDSKSIDRFNWIYVQQNYVNDLAIAVIVDEPRIGAPLRIANDPANLSPAEIESMLIGSAEIDIKLATLQSVMKSLDDMYTEALKNL